MPAAPVPPIVAVPPHGGAQRGARRGARIELAILLIGALAVYTANPFGILLPAMDDCFYARKGVEMARSGGFFSVTWNGSPEFQNPSLQIWLLGRSFALLGENDLAARLPSIAFAIGTLLIVYRLGTLLLGTPTALGAVALLAISPYFGEHARRCMMDMALGFWVALTFLIAIEGLARPRLHLLLAIPLAAALLTKSLLGLLPLVVLGACALVSETFRRPLRNPWWWGGILIGLALGAFWTVHQTLRFGPAVLRVHYLEQVAHQISKPLGVWRHLTGFPIHLLERFHPAILPALAGAVLIARRLASGGDARLWLLLLWPLVPLLIYSGFGAQETRYLFPLFPPLVIAAAWAIESRAPVIARWVRRGLAPTLLAIAAAWLWIAPPRFVVQADRALAEHRGLLRSRIPRDEPLTYLARVDAFWYWPVLNPLMYYAERFLEHPAPSVETAVTRALGRKSRLLLCDREMLPALPAALRAAPRPLSGEHWVLIDLAAGANRQSRPR